MEKILSNGSHENLLFFSPHYFRAFFVASKMLDSLSVSHSECATIEQVLPVVAETGWE
jgi:hypothetical protein